MSNTRQGPSKQSVGFLQLMLLLLPTLFPVPSSYVLKSRHVEIKTYPCSASSQQHPTDFQQERQPKSFRLQPRHPGQQRARPTIHTSDRPFLNQLNLIREKGIREQREKERRRTAKRTIRAAGCRTAMCFKIVAPSLVMTTSPWAVWIYHIAIPKKRSQTNEKQESQHLSSPTSRKGHESERTILSIPLGPSEVRTASETDLAAVMLDSRTSIGLPCAKRGNHESFGVSFALT